MRFVLGVGAVVLVVALRLALEVAGLGTTGGALSGEGLSPRASLGTGGLAAAATLGHARLLRGGDGEVVLHVGIDAVGAPSVPLEKRPIDLVLVVDVSSSMDEAKVKLLKRACLGILDRLRDQDRAAVLASADGARAVFPLEFLGPRGRRERFREVVEALAPSGRPALARALAAGAAELHRAAARGGAATRLLLLTDGRGGDDRGTLHEMARRLARAGVTVSTVGLGADYDERLLSSLAEEGGGTFHHAETADWLAPVYESEVSAARSLVARGVRLSIVPAPGVELASVYFWRVEKTGEGAVEVPLGDFSTGRHAKVVARLRVPASTDLAKVAAATVALRAEDARGRTPAPLASRPVSLAYELVPDPALAAASRAAELAGELEGVAIADALARAHEAALAQRPRDVLIALLALERRLGRQEVEWTDPDGSRAKLNLRGLALAFGAQALGGRAEIGALRAVASSESIFREGDKDGAGVIDYGSLAELSNADLVDTVLGGGQKQGYAFQASPATNAGEFLWFAVANPNVSPTTGDRYFETNQAGVIYYEKLRARRLDERDANVATPAVIAVGK